MKDGRKVKISACAPLKALAIIMCPFYDALYARLTLSMRRPLAHIFFFLLSKLTCQITFGDEIQAQLGHRVQ